MESIKAMAEFTGVLKHNPKQAYDFICNNSYKMDKTEVVTIVKELLYGIYNDCQSTQVEKILENVATELDDQYDELYQEIGMKSFIVSWFADGYNGTFNYLVVATDIEKAKEMWKEFIEHNDNLAYSWEKAERGVKNHYGGYITWKDNGVCDKEAGCYELEYNRWNVGSDHLWD